MSCRQPSAERSRIQWYGGKVELVSAATVAVNEAVSDVSAALQAELEQLRVNYGIIFQYVRVIVAELAAGVAKFYSTGVEADGTITTRNVHSSFAATSPLSGLRT